MRKSFWGLSALVMACSGCNPTGLVSPVVASVLMVPSTVTLSVGSTLRFAVIVRNPSGQQLTNRKITFSSSDELVLSVDSTGLVRALAEGTAMLTATSEGKRDWGIIWVVPVCDESCRPPWDYAPVP